MAPPVTPSPHRFVQNPRQIPATRPPVQPSSKNQTSASTPRFNSTPRFSFSSTPKHSDAAQVAPSSPLVARTRRPPAFKTSVDSVEDVQDDAHDQALHDDQEENEMILDSTEFDLPPPLKKRRTTGGSQGPLTTPAPHFRSKLEHDPIVIDSSPHENGLPSSPTSPPPELDATAVVPPQTPVQGRNTHGPTFKTPAQPTEASAQSRLNFILPAATERSPEELLPQLFSPHRRGQRYVTGGVASTLRDWVVELTSGARSAQKLHSRLGLRNAKDSVTIRISRMADSQDGDCVQVVTTTGERWLLMGGHRPDKKDKSLHPGDTVELSLPVWEVELAEGSYIAAVNWK